MKRALTALTGILASTSLLAQSIDEVVVTASPLETPRSLLPGGINQFSRDEIIQSGASQIGDLIGNQPGLNSASFGAGVGLPVIRGLSGSRVLVARDGQPVMDVSSTSADHAIGDEIFHTDQIEVLRGPSTLRFGPGAIGGVVNFAAYETMPIEGLSGRLNASHNTNGSGENLNLDLAYGMGAFALEGGMTYRQQGNIEISGLADPDVDDSDETTRGYVGNTGLENASTWGQWRWSSGNLTAAVRIDEMDNQYGVPSGAHSHAHGHEEEHQDEDHAEEHGEDEHHDEHGEDETVRIEMTKRVISPSVEVLAPFAGIDVLTLQTAFTQYEHTEIETVDETDIVGTRFERDGFSSRVEAVHSLFGAPGYLGFEVRENDFEAAGDEAFVPPSDLESAGLYWVQRSSLGETHFEVGARFDEQEISSPGAGSFRHETLNLGLSGSVPLLDGRLGVQIGRSERAPTSTELLAEGLHVATNSYEIGDSGLSNESSDSIELSYFLEGPLRVEFSVFHQDFENFLYASDTGLLFNEELHDTGVHGLAACTTAAGFDHPEEAEEALECFAYVEDGATFTGYELSFGMDLNDKASVNFWTDSVDAELSSGGHVPRMPPQRMGLGFDYRGESVSGSLSLTKAYEQKDVAEGETSTGGYFRLDASLVRDFGSLRLFLSGRNLTNQDIRLSTSYLKDIAPEPGRSLLLGASYSF